jgi:hypothetical protein
MAKINRFMYSEFLGNYVDGEFGSTSVGKAFLKHFKYLGIDDQDLKDENISSVAIRKIWNRYVVGANGQQVWDGES